MTINAIIHRPTRFENAIEQLVAAKRSEHTRIAYAHEAKRWATFCAAHGIDPLVPALGHAVAFRDGLSKQLSKDSVCRALAALSSLYGGLVRTGLAPHNPFHQSLLAWPKQNREGRTQMLTDDEIDRMLVTCAADASERGVRDLTILRLLRDTGLRRESIASIDRTHYKPPELRVSVKGGYDRTIELIPETSAQINRWLDIAPASRFMFPTLDGKRHIDVSAINKLVRARGIAAGVEHAHPHRFRAAFITAAYDAGIPERDIQAAAGHTDPMTTRRYDRGVRGLDVAAKIAEHRKRKGG